MCWCIKSLTLDWIITGCESAFMRQSLDNHSDISEEKNVGLKNPKNIYFFVSGYKLCLE